MRGPLAVLLVLVLAATWLLPPAASADVPNRIQIPIAYGEPDSVESRPVVAPAVQQQPAAQVGGPFYFGAQAHLFWTDRPRVVNLARDAGFGWIKQQVRWDMVEGEAQGVYDWRELDAAIAAASNGGLRVLLSVAAAPHWATGGNPVDGPPLDYQRFADFMRVLAQRYHGRVQAYEIWNEQNLWYEWGGKGRLDAADYVGLLRLAYGAIKAVDPDAIVVSGAPTPTGVNDGEVAIDDLVYLEQMYAAGLREVADAIGAHPHGYNNPPDDWIDTQTVSSESFKGHASFYFRRLEQYRLLMERLGDADRPIWITEMGWTTANDARGYEYGRDNSEDDQARYLVRAFEKARDEYPWVQAMFVWSLNFATIVPPHDEKYPWSIIDGDWSPRPAYSAIRAMPKGERQIGEPRPATAAHVAEIAHTAGCTWQITFALEGFAPHADVSAESHGHYDACGRGAGPYATPAEHAGRADGNGRLVVSYPHLDFGTYTYRFEDSVGRAAEVTFAYAP